MTDELAFIKHLFYSDYNQTLGTRKSCNQKGEVEKKNFDSIKINNQKGKGSNPVFLTLLNTTGRLVGLVLKKMLIPL